MNVDMTITNLQSGPKQTPYPPKPAPHAALSENPIRLQPPEKADTAIQAIVNNNLDRINFVGMKNYIFTMNPHQYKC